jgi:hypothetical protein
MDATGAVGMSSAVTVGDDIRFWAGNVTPAIASFRVTEAGVLTANSATITGAINATSGKIGTSTNYWSIGATGISAVSASTDVIINYGKIDFGQDDTAGFILGYDYSASKSKFEIGSSASKIFKYDGVDFSLIGGTITGGIVQTNTSGYRIKLNGTSGKLEFLNGNTVLSSAYPNASGDFIVDATDDIYFFCAGSERASVGSSGMFATQYNLGAYQGETFENMRVTTDVYHYHNGEAVDIRAKYRDIDIRGGIITDVTNETTYTVLATVWNG